MVSMIETHWVSIIFNSASNKGSAIFMFSATRDVSVVLCLTHSRCYRSPCQVICPRCPARPLRFRLPRMHRPLQRHHLRPRQIWAAGKVLKQRGSGHQKIWIQYIYIYIYLLYIKKHLERNTKGSIFSVSNSLHIHSLLCIYIYYIYIYK